MKLSRGAVRPASTVFLTILMFAFTVGPVGPTRACATGSMYIVTVHPERVKVGGVVNISISIAVTDPEPSIPLILSVEAPGARKKDFPLTVEVNQGGFGEASLQYPTASAGKYTITLFRPVQKETTEVASKAFTAYGETTVGSQKNSEKPRTQAYGFEWLTASLLVVAVFAMFLLAKRLHKSPFSEPLQSRKG